MMKVVVLFMCSICGVFGSSHEAEPFSKQNNSYVRVLENVPIQELSVTNDYVTTISELLENAKNGVAVTAEHLNKFSDGINQYYVSKASEYYEEMKPAVPLARLTDPILLPNYTAAGTPEICFYDVKVYGFPPFKDNYKVINEFNTCPYFRSFEVLFIAPSDTVLFTGSFTIYRDKYFFVYETTANSYQSKHLKVRTQHGLVHSKTTTDSLSFSSGRLSHTYDSYLKYHAEVNEKLTSHFETALKWVYLPKLAVSAGSIIAPKLTVSSMKFLELHRQKLRELMVQAAIQLATCEHFVDLKISPMVFKNEDAISKHNRTAVITYDNISVDGLFNFVKYEFSEPCRNASNNSVLSLHDKVTFHYPESTGDKFACVTFTMKTRLFDAVKKARVKSLTIETAVFADMRKFPPTITPNRDMFDTSTGVSVDLDVELEEPAYYFVILHAAKDITRVLDSLIFDSEKKN